MPLPDPRPLTLASVNRMGRAEFAAALGGVFEHSQSVAEAAWPAAPFADVAALHRAMVRGGARGIARAPARADPSPSRPRRQGRARRDNDAAFGRRDLPGHFERRAQDDPGAVFQEFRTVLDGLLSDPSRPLGLRTGSGSLCPERSFTP